MVELKNESFIIDGVPKLILCGEVHYFRVPRMQWQDRIDKLKEAGCNAVASYVPWICHEPTPGIVDLKGDTRPELNLWGFIDLCRENGLYFLLRPGPFIMAEMKNEGLPTWLFRKHPEIIPRGWDNEPCRTKNVDVLSPSFLEASRRWYQAVLSGARYRIQPEGGNIIAIQLDNEVGMLSWVANSPDFTDLTIDEFLVFISEQYTESQLKLRYGSFLDKIRKEKTSLLSPDATCAICVWNDLASFLRYRYVIYLNYLKKIAKSNGIHDIPFVINIHGTANSRALSFPIGISQLQQCYQSADNLAGSDLYLGNLSRNNIHDLYLANALLKSSAPDDAPISSVEFEAGDGDYAQTLGGYDDSATDLKLRLSVAQGNRLINLYLFSGGYNYRFEEPLGDGDDRIAFTGERHGTAAPINPEGKQNRTYARLARCLRTIGVHASALADASEMTDPLLFGFVSDYYRTECFYPKSIDAREFVSVLEKIRGGRFWDATVKAVLFSGYRMRAIDLKFKWPDPESNNVLIMPSARYMRREMQEELAQYLLLGGHVLLIGELPTMDLDGFSCTKLVDLFGIRNIKYLTECPEKYLTVQNAGLPISLAEFHTSWAQTYGLPDAAVPLLCLYPDKECCGFDLKTSKGRLICLTVETIADTDLYTELIKKLGVVPSLIDDDPDHGIFSTLTKLKHGGAFLHVINLDDKNKSVKFLYQNKALMDGSEIRIAGKSGLILPMGLSVYDTTSDSIAHGYDLIYATGELYEMTPHRLAVYNKNGNETVLLRTKGKLTIPSGCVVKQNGDLYQITFPHSHFAEMIRPIYIR